jgi:hypothetical protein
MPGRECFYDAMLMGVLHVGTTARDSLACDLMEVVRPQVDAYLLDWITRQSLNREWFFEQRVGNCHLMAPFAVELSRTAPSCGHAVAPITEWVARAFWSTIRKPNAPLATRLTQTNKREAKGKAPSLPTPAPRPENICLACGKDVAKGSTRCAHCAVVISKERMLDVARRGRLASKSPEARARVAATQRRHATAWGKWLPSSQPDWLTEESYTTKVKPLLVRSSNAEIARTLHVSIPYAASIRSGRRRPHPRHWNALSGLVGMAGSS